MTASSSLTAVSDPPYPESSGKGYEYFSDYRIQRWGEPAASDSPQSEFSVMSLGSLFKKCWNFFIIVSGSLFFCFVFVIDTRILYLYTLCDTAFSLHIVSSVVIYIFLFVIISYCCFIAVSLFVLETHHYYLISLFTSSCRWGTQ